MPKGGKIGEALRYGSTTGTALTRFPDDGRIESIPTPSSARSAAYLRSVREIFVIV